MTLRPDYRKIQTLLPAPGWKMTWVAEDRSVCSVDLIGWALLHDGTLAAVSIDPHVPNGDSLIFGQDGLVATRDGTFCYALQHPSMRAERREEVELAPLPSCQYCGAGIGQMCRTASGEERDPHWCRTCNPMIAAVAEHDCPSCGQPAGQPCVTKSGAFYPHDECHAARHRAVPEDVPRDSEARS